MKRFPKIKLLSRKTNIPVWRILRSVIADNTLGLTVSQFDYSRGTFDGIKPINIYRYYPTGHCLIIDDEGELFGYNENENVLTDIDREQALRGLLREAA